MKAFYTVGLLIVANVFMTFAWYGHLKLKEASTWFASLPLFAIIVFSWMLAFSSMCYKYLQIESVL